MPSKKVSKVTKVVAKSKTVKKETVVAKSSLKKSDEAISKRNVQKKEILRPSNKLRTQNDKGMKGLSAAVYDIAGKSQGTISLPADMFGQTVNKNLLAQAMRVYFANQSTHTASTKTRAEVRGGGRKPWKQKGTGNARAGSKRSPLWVGGGISLGPRFRDVKLDLPKKMKKKALMSALSLKQNMGQIKVITNLEAQSPKTKIIANLLTKLDTKGKTLLVTAKPNENIKLASRNIPKVTVDSFINLNAYEVMKPEQILFSKEVFK